ncbi:MAG: TPM domain-containing protein [Spirochaetes bacterium]|nr:TPM domain-containing protein [Spirochaetota bacterium]
MKLPVRSLALLTCLIALPLQALDVPVLKGRVNDYAGMLSPGTAATLEARLADFERNDSTQIVVLTVPSLQGEVLEEFSMRVAESWKIGQAKQDNGVILLVAKEERRIRIEVGYGLEGSLTDLLAGRIIDGIITPAFKAGDFDRGVTEGVDAIMEAVRGEYRAVTNRIAEKEGSDPGKTMTPFFFSLVFISIIGKIRRILGGIAGAVILPIVAGIAFGFTLYTLLVIPGGFLLGLIIPTVMPLFFSGSGGSSGSGWIGGSGGGFSGGGGGFGGGGASGGW